MPVASPTRYSSTSLSGSYRSSLSTSSSLDKPYYRSTGSHVTTTHRSTYGDTTTEYRSRYSDVDGKRERKTSLVEYSRSSRAPSVTDSDSGISSRYRSERSESRSRELSTSRSDTAPRVKRAPSSALAMSAAELYQKYSPSNYVPLTQRLQQQQNNYSEIARSKSISNDIGRPPLSDAKTLRKPRNSTSTINERPERKYKEITPPPSYSKRNSMTNGVKDSNGNEVPSVSEIRRKFDQKMTVTKLPTNDSRYTKASVEQYLNQLKECENGSSGYTKMSKDDKPVPIHLPSVEKNGSKWDSNSSSRSNSNSDISLSKTISEPALSKPIHRNGSVTTSLTIKPSDRLASIKSQLDPNNPIGKILEKSTVITTENGDSEYKKRYSPDVKSNLINDAKTNLKNEIEKQVKAPKHTSNFASYIQISQPVASGATKKENNEELNNKDKKKVIKYIDEEKTILDNEIESPSGTGFENKTFEHENFLKKRSELNEEVENNHEEPKSMETSTESTISEPTEEESTETSSVRKKLEKDYEDSKGELAGGKSSSGLRRSTEREREAPAEREARHEKPSQTSGLNGLRNIGNTCFMNSVVQCLSNTRPLLEYVVADKHVPETNTTLSPMRGALIAAFASMIKELWRSGERDSVVNTTTFKSQVQRFAPRFMGYSQQDAQEFLRYLLEGLHEDVNRVTVKPKPILTEIDDTLSDSAKAAEAWSRYCRLEQSRVSDIFVGQLKSTLRCTHCNHDSVTFDPFWDLSLPIPSRTGNLKIQQCLQHFTKEEEMDGDEKPTCSKCGVRRKCLKWFSIQKFPQVLVLHLKRFSPTERFRGKLSVQVEFPLTGLDMSPYAASRSQSVTYNLYAVSNHSGTTYSGHYTAYCKHPYTGDWHEYNDSRLSPIKPRDVVSPEAYVLFYERT